MHMKYGMGENSDEIELIFCVEVIERFLYLKAAGRVPRLVEKARIPLDSKE